MRSLLAAVSLFLCMHALGQPTEIYCEACRDVYTSPEDFGNYAYNSVLGQNPTVSLANGDQLIVTNPQGQWAIVDLAFVMQNSGLSLSLVVVSYLVPVPSGEIEITIQDPRGNITRRRALSGTPDLLVGAESSPPPAPVELPPDVQASIDDLQDIIWDLLWEIEIDGPGMLQIIPFIGPLISGLGMLGFLISILAGF